MSRKRKPKPVLELEELEFRADEILRKDTERAEREAEMAEIIKRNTEAIERLEQIQHELIQPNNDPKYLAALEAHNKTRQTISNSIASVHICPDGQETWIGVSITNRHDHATAIETARLMGEHFEAKIITHENAQGQQ